MTEAEIRRGFEELVDVQGLDISLVIDSVSGEYIEQATIGAWQIYSCMKNKNSSVVIHEYKLPELPKPSNFIGVDKQNLESCFSEKQMFAYGATCIKDTCQDAVINKQIIKNVLLSEGWAIVPSNITELMKVAFDKQHALAYNPTSTYRASHTWDVLLKAAPCYDL